MLYDKDYNFLFVLANQGAGGHRLGRIISCLNNVYWYSSKNNGLTPSDVFYNETVAGKSISAYHYDRTIGTSTLPILGERILKWWNVEDYNIFYKDYWLSELKKISLPDNMIMHWVLHDQPKDLHDRFPNAKIISLIDTDLDLVTERYTKTTSKFPCAIKHFNLKPPYKNEYARVIDSLVAPTEQDVWYYLNKDASPSDYFNHIKENLTMLNNARKSYIHKNHLSITWETLDIDLIKTFLNSSSINEDYLTLTIPKNF